MQRAACLLLVFMVFFTSFNYIQITIKISRRRDLIYRSGIPTTVHSSKYCIAYNLTKARKSFREDHLEPISLATHTTSLYLNLLEEQVQTWDGPISLALFIDRGSASAVQFLMDLYRCDRAYADKVYRGKKFLTEHIRSPVEFKDFCEHIGKSTLYKIDMDFHVKTGKSFVQYLVPPFGIYPINVMRNVARRGAPSSIHLISDIEMVFSSKFAENAKKIANEHIKKNGKKLIVIRRFEVEEKVQVPRNYSSLKKLIDARLAFEFHHRLFPAGHTIEALWEWFKRSAAKREPYVWEIPYKNPSWEPQFIMHATDPLSEEGMPTRVRDQQALAYELCRANYTFLLASQLFNVHRGVKRVTTNMDSAVVEHQARLRYRAFKNFISRIDSSYPKTITRCKKFIM